MVKTEYRYGVKHIRGAKKGTRFTNKVTFSSPEFIHSFLWNTAEMYDKRKCDYIIEWYRKA